MQKDREKLVFTKQYAQELALGYVEGWKTIEDKITDHTRWSIVHEVIVQREADGKYFASSYQVGATEQQDEQPYEHTDPEFTEVFKTEKTITIFE